MGYFALDFVPGWLMTFAIPPLIGLLGISGGFHARIYCFLRLCGLSIAMIIAAVAIGVGFLASGFVVGLVFAIWGMPVLAIACALVIVIKANGREAETEARISRLKAQGVDIESNGLCPNCEGIVSLDSAECPHCKVLFGKDAAWKVRPLK